jgi:hypothetical protein
LQLFGYVVELMFCNALTVHEVGFAVAPATDRGRVDGSESSRPRMARERELIVVIRNRWDRARNCSCKASSWGR